MSSAAQANTIMPVGTTVSSGAPRTSLATKCDCQEDKQHNCPGALTPVFSFHEMSSVDVFAVGRCESFYPTGGPFSRRDFRRRMAQSDGQRGGDGERSSHRPFVQLSAARVGVNDGTVTTPSHAIGHIVIVHRTGIGRADRETTANTVMQTSSVASENCSFMAASLPPAQKKARPVGCRAMAAPLGNPAGKHDCNRGAESEARKNPPVYSVSSCNPCHPSVGKKAPAGACSVAVLNCDWQCGSSQQRKSPRLHIDESYQTSAIPTSGAITLPAPQHRYGKLR